MRSHFDRPLILVLTIFSRCINFVRIGVVSLRRLDISPPQPHVYGAQEWLRICHNLKTRGLKYRQHGSTNFAERDGVFTQHRYT